MWKTEITHETRNIHVAKEEMPQIPNTDLVTQSRYPRKAGQIPAKHVKKRRRWNTMNVVSLLSRRH